MELENLLPSDANYQEEINVKTMNDLAIILLTMSVTDAVSYSAIHNSYTVEYADGNAAIAWKNLNKIFKPISSAQKHELEQEFNKCCLHHEDTNPDEWFAELEKMRLQLRVDFKLIIDEEKLKTHILYNIKPKFYDTIITVMKRDINKDPTNLSVEQIKEEIRQMYGQFKTNQSKPKGKNFDNALITKGNFKKQVKTDCRICGKKGHKAVNCWENPNNTSKKPKNFKPKPARAYSVAAVMTQTKGDPKRQCSYCNRKGHTEEYCWSKQKKNESNQNQYKTKIEHAEVHFADIDKPEYANITYSGYVAGIGHSVTSEDYEEEVTKNTFIADSGATCHMGYSSEGMHNLKPFRTPIKVGNAEAIMSESIGSFTGMVIQEIGDTLSLTLKEVLYVPSL